MALVTLEEFNSYSQVEGDTLAEIYIDAASDIVSDFLGFDPSFQTYVKRIDGNGTNRIPLHAMPIKEISEVLENGIVMPIDSFYSETQYLFWENKNFKTGERNYKITFTAGFETIPGIIKTTVFRIASILQSESGGNAGITSKTFGDSGSRTFYKTKFDDYLIPLQKYKLYE